MFQLDLVSSQRMLCNPRRPDGKTRRAVKGKEKVEQELMEKVEIDVEPQVLSALAAGPDRNHPKTTIEKCRPEAKVMHGPGT